MSNRLYVGNLPFSATQEMITEHMARCGEVQSVEVVMDRVSGQPRGFAFVEMATQEGMQKAIADLDGQDFDGRAMRVRVAEERRGGGGGGGGPRGRGGGGGGDRGRGGGRGGDRGRGR